FSAPAVVRSFVQCPAEPPAWLFLFRKVKARVKSAAKPAHSQSNPEALSANKPPHQRKSSRSATFCFRSQIMKPTILTLITLTLVILCIPALSQQKGYEQLKTDAERFYAEQSYAKAHELYKQAEGLASSQAEARWVAFRLADTLWLSEAGGNTSDSTRFDQAHEQLEKLIRDIKRPEEQDQLWVEVQESLADFSWTRRNSQDWNQAWPHYQQALDWWAGQSNLDAARQRYLQLFWKAIAPPLMDSYYGSYYRKS